jgi:hypothetical protein
VAERCSYSMTRAGFEGPTVMLYELPNGNFATDTISKDDF